MKKQLKNIHEFESFNLNDPQSPVKEENQKKYVLSSVTKKSEFFSMLKKEEKAVIAALIGKEVEVKQHPNDPNYYILTTGNEKFPECKIPKRLIYD